jgi:hypothetical protein
VSCPSQLATVDQMQPCRRRTMTHHPPKPPPKAFVLFCKDERPSVCERCPSMGPSDVMAVLSHLWRSLDDESKAWYKQEELRLQHEGAAKMEFLDPIPGRDSHLPPLEWIPFLPVSHPVSTHPPMECTPNTQRTPARAITRRFDVRPPSQERPRIQSLEV